MSFPESIRTVLANYASFAGRAPRSEYWWFVLFYTLVYAAAAVLDVALFSGSSGGIGLLTTLLSLALLLPSLAVSARRLHDTDRSGWWLLLSLVPLIGAIVLIVFFVQRGTEGSNRFGPPPLGGEAVATLR